MVRGPLPIAARLKHGMRLDVPGELRGGPHMIEPAPTVVLRPVRRAIAPPGEAAFGRGHEPSADVDPVVRLLKPGQSLNLDRGVADDSEQRLVTPDVAFERGDVEVADDDGRLVVAFRPAGHASDEVELLAELGVDGTVRSIAARWDIDILEPNAAVEPDADVPGLAIVLPIVLARVLERNAAEDCDAMVHTLAVQFRVHIAVSLEQLDRKDTVQHLGFLETQDVRLLLGDQPFDQPDARAHRVDVP